MDKLNIIAKFDCDGKMYIIALAENKIVFYLYSNKVFSRKLTNEEIKICYFVLDAILVRKETSIFLKNKKIRSNTYQIFYDTTTRLYWWKANNYCEICEEDNSILMTLYNYSPDMYFLNQEKDTVKKKSSIVKIIKGKLCRIMINTMLFCILPSIVVNESYRFIENYVIEEQRQEIDENFDYNWRKLEQSVDENKHLSQEEKEYLKKLRFFYDKDHQYMNIPMNIKRLKTLKFRYFNKRIPFAPFSIGVYMPFYNCICFAHSQNFDDVHDEVKIHELFHMMAINSSGKSNEYVIQIATNEGLKKLIELGEIDHKDEFYDSNGGLSTTLQTAYAQKSALFYLLLELVDEETRLKYLYQTDETVLAEALIELDKSSNLDEARKRAYNLVLDFANFEYEDKDLSKEKFEDYSNEDLYRNLDYYFNIKHGYSISYDLNSVLVFFDNDTSNRGDFLYNYNYSNSSLICDAIETSFNLPSYVVNYEMTAQPKGLFEDINPTIYYKEGGENKSIQITEDEETIYMEEYLKEARFGKER